MKIGILTYHASHNYGSMLQAYALQHYLHSVGHDAETINLRSNVQKQMYNFPLVPVKGKLRRFLKSIVNPVWLYHECRKWYGFEDFLKQKLRLTAKEYKSWLEIKNDLPSLGYQCVITGGDQIWSLRAVDFEQSYYLPGELTGIKKISYAPSFGDLLSKMKKSDDEFIKSHLSDFFYISVRETSMQTYLSHLLNRSIDVVLDPTLLLEAKDYEPLYSKKPLINGKYIFYYTPGINFELERFALKIGKFMGLPIVTSYPRILKKGGFISAYEVGPGEFLNLVKNAAFVVGKSFHLVVFSLIFHKEFIAIDGNSDERMKSFLSQFSLIERGSVNEQNYKMFSFSSIDYDQVDKILKEKREFSKHALIGALF